MTPADHHDPETASRRRFLKATGGLAGASLLAGTGAATEASAPEVKHASQETPAETAQTLRLINVPLTSLDPIASGDVETGEVLEQLFDSLTTYPNGETTVAAQLATDYEVSDDFTTYTFTLADATFHNGDQVTAQDVVYSFERLAFSEHSQQPYFLLDILGVRQPSEGEIAVEAVDDETVRIAFDQPFHSVLGVLAYAAFSVVPEGIVGDIEGYDGEIPYEEFASNPIGAGHSPSTRGSRTARFAWPATMTTTVRSLKSRAFTGRLSRTARRPTSTR